MVLRAGGTDRGGLGNSSDAGTMLEGWAAQGEGAQAHGQVPRARRVHPASRCDGEKGSWCKDRRRVAWWRQPVDTLLIAPLSRWAGVKSTVDGLLVQ